MAKKRQTLTDYYNAIPMPVKVLAYGFLAWRGYKIITREIELARLRKIQRDQANPAYNTSGGVYQFEGGSPYTTPQTNFATVAQSIYKAYNPDGWNSDEIGMLTELEKIAPTSFRSLENYYNTTFNRNLIADFDEQMSGEIFEGAWLLYKSKI